MASSPELQIELVQRALSTQSDRAKFLSNPETYAKTHNVQLDAGFKDAMVTEMTRLERRAAGLHVTNPFLAREKVVIANLPKVGKVGGIGGGAIGPVANAAAVAAGAAVVSAAAAVVSAATAVYNSTKFNQQFTGFDVMR